jgi:hypothetical protein
MRFVETLIRASTCFFLEYLGREAGGREFMTSQLADGVSAISVFVDALRPWWKERLQGRCGGLDSVLSEPTLDVPPYP